MFKKYSAYLLFNVFIEHMCILVQNLLKNYFNPPIHIPPASRVIWYVLAPNTEGGGGDIKIPQTLVRKLDN
jgi:hypothetical protein